ncbi:MAG: cytochrome c3 family protein [Candidatus Hinthialibacter antarcticus]|nr:cytochrome c3 family protein [Candidatus Hinthialibacter antarcticus]
MKTTSMFILLIACLTAPLFISAHEDQPLDCKQCHTCLNPTEEEPCLVPCPRNTSQVLPIERMGPDIVILDELQAIEDLYVPVRFNHETHAHMSSTADGCVTCHHYNENSIAPAACVTCHPMEIIHENLAQPGLKGAYHRQCIGCHIQWDPNTECVVCHEKKAGGRLHGVATTVSTKRFYPIVKMRDLIVYETEYEEGDKVPFHHRTHAMKYDRNCGDCHIDQSCDACHTQGMAELKPMGDIAPDEMHDHCFVCHGEAECEHCHGRETDNVFSHDITGWQMKPYHEPAHCRDCHSVRGEFVALNPSCKSCHASGWPLEGFDHAVTGAKFDEVHIEAECENCHGESLSTEGGVILLQQEKIAISCSECHDEDWKYDPAVGFAAQ